MYIQNNYVTTSEITVNMRFISKDFSIFKHFLSTFI